VKSACKNCIFLRQKSNFLTIFSEKMTFLLKKVKKIENFLAKIAHVANIDSILGPVSIVAGKRRRITFIEVKNDINSMIDAAKVADLVFFPFFLH
jgi:hypothetical protein